MIQSENKKYSAMDVLKIYIIQKSRRYEKEGRFAIRGIKNKDCMRRLLAFLTDSIFMFMPIYLWVIIVLLIFTDIVPVHFIWIVQILMLILLAFSMGYLQPMLTAKLKGNSPGKTFTRLKIVRMDGREANTKQLFLREFLSKGLPVYVFGLLFGILGLIGYTLFSLLFIFIEPKHRSWSDFITKTRVIVLLDKRVSPVSPVQKKAEALGLSENKIDLHMHSTFSDDGEFNVEEIFQMASKRGMKLISITDHNSAKANAIAQRMSKLYHVDYITGIEIDCQYKGLNFHMLGYFIDHKSELYKKIENDNLMKEKDASLKRVAMWEEYSGMKVDVDALMRNNRFQTIAGEMIGEQMLNHPEYRKSPLLKPYIDGDRSEMPYVNFYWDFFSQGKPCYVPIKYPDASVIIKLIKATGGIPILAHAFANFADNLDVIEELLNLGVEGLEVFSSYHSTKQMSYLLNIANERKCYITVGSDFHGKNKPQIKIGDTGCPKGGEKIVNRFIHAKDK